MAQGQYEGRGSTFDQAAEKASEKAKDHGEGPYRMEIQVKVGNSIHEYIVILSPTP